MSQHKKSCQFVCLLSFWDTTANEKLKKDSLIQVMVTIVVVMMW